MTKEHKQLVLVVILSITLYAVWPSGRKAGQRTTGVAAAHSSTSTENADADSKVHPAGHIASREHLDSSETIEFPRQTITFRQRWSIEEILKMGSDGRSRSSTSVDGNTTQVNVISPNQIQAVYFTSSSSNTGGSAIIGGQVVKPGYSLPGNRVIGEIHQHGIAIQSID